MDNTKISTWELVSLTSVITFTPLLVTLPRSAAEAFGTGALLHAIYIGIIVTIYFLAVFKLYKNLVDKDIFDLLLNSRGIFYEYLLRIMFVTLSNE